MPQINIVMGFINTTFSVNLTTGPAYFRNSTMDYFGEMIVGGTVPVEVTVKDRNLNPLGGHSVALTATAGSIAASPVITDRYGTATFLYTAVADTSIAQSAYLTATDSDPLGGITVVKKVTFSDFIKPKPGDDPATPETTEFADSK